MAAVNGDRLTRYTAVAAVLAVAAVAAWVSYRHAVDVVSVRGEPGAIGRWYPVTIDGLIVASSMVLLDAARHRERAPILAWWLLAAGIAVTLAANVTYGAAYGLASALWATWPAAAFVGCYELLMMLVRASARRAPRPAVAVEEPQLVEVPSPVASSAEAAAEASLRETLRAGNPWSKNALVTRFGVDRQTAAEIHDRVIPKTAELPALEQSVNGSGPHD